MKKTFITLAAALATSLPVGGNAAETPSHAGKPVVFESSDLQLQKLHDSAAEKIQQHLIEYAPGFKVLANSGDYTGLFLENAALNGENYARFDPRFAVNNIRVFFITQREDGKFPNVIWPGYRMRERPRKLTEFTPMIPELDGAVANLYRDQRDLPALPCLAYVFLGRQGPGLPAAIVSCTRKIRHLPLENAGFRWGRPTGIMVHFRFR